MTLFGVLTTAIWLSGIIFLPPFSPHPNVRAALKEVDPRIRNIAPGMNAPDDVIERNFNKAYNRDVAVSYSIILLGAVSGVCISVGMRIGYYGAFLLCLVQILIRVMHVIERYPDNIEAFRLFASHFPGLAAYDVIRVVFYVGSIAFISINTVTSARSSKGHLTTG